MNTKITLLGIIVAACVCSNIPVEVQSAVPAAPINVRINPLAHNQVKISWRDNSSDETGFEIQRSANGVNYTTITSVAANATSYVDTKVSAFAPYIYRVCSVNDKEKSDYVASNSAITSAFPALTSLTDTRHYTASEKNNNSPASEGVDNVFDDNKASKYLTRTATTWVKIEFDEPYQVEHYSITAANDEPTRDPRAWKLEASANGSSWSAIDSRSSEVFDARYQKRFFEIADPAPYKYYRLNISQNRGNSITQFADWLLYADVQAVTSEFTPETPTNFRVEVRSCNQVKLTWNDVAGESAYRIERSENGGVDYTYTYEIDANNIQSFPYALNPETNYRFKLYAVSGDRQSEPVYVDAVTPKEEWIERWENLNLWIFETPITVVKVKQIGNTAFYMLEKDNAEMINDLYYDFYAQNWDYVFKTYGDALSDRRLHVFLFPLDDGGGLASIYDYRSDVGGYRNMVYIKANKAWFQSRSESGYIYDVMAHELCHIVEGVGGGYGGSMFYPVWGDSKWAEILQYDLFKNLESPRAATWHYEFTHGSGGCDYPDPEQTSYWYRDFLYPTYEAYGQTSLLQRFWKLLGQYYRHKDGDFQGSPVNPGGRGNLGELIHFWSAAAETNVKQHAVNAFGWNDQFEMWLQRAKVDYPELQYPEPPIDASEKNICQNGGTFTSNLASSNNIRNLNDNSYTSNYLVRQDAGSGNFILTYTSPQPAMINRYLVAVRDEIVPASWTFSASLDGRHWDEIDRQPAPDFAVNANKISVNIENSAAYQYFRWEFAFKENGQIKLTEIELHGLEYTSVPSDLRAKRQSDTSVYLDWLCPIEEIAGIGIERSINGVDFQPVETVSPYEISYMDENLTPGVYYYRIAAQNQSPEKARVYSNIVSVNTQTDGLFAPSLQALSFREALNHLSRYSGNQVKIHSILGQKLFDNTYSGDNLAEYMQSQFQQGIYLVNIRIGEDSVNGKI
ncbi:MAG: fibronectin type III domain-containing protein, partial [Candidatus Symbiothrix sp.]|nr:fibronectin type III domain-containing protein [Candidatus Symbiothrix sp.]